MPESPMTPERMQFVIRGLAEEMEKANRADPAAALRYVLSRLEALDAVGGALQEAAAMMAEFADGDAEHLEEFTGKWQLRFMAKAKEARAVLAADALLRGG
jgi:hypothetical protein